MTPASLSTSTVRAAFAALILALSACTTRTPAPVVDRPVGAAPRAAPAPAPPPVVAEKPPETDWRPPTYTIKRGDTLYQIALDHGLDYRDLAQWNNLDNPNRILIGQVLQLRSPNDAAKPGATPSGDGVTTAPLRAPPPVVETRPGVPPVAAAGAPPAPTTAARNTDSLKVSPKAIKEPYSEQVARDLARAATQVAPVEPAPPAPPAPPAVIARADPSPRSITPPAAAEAGDEKVDWAWPANGKLVTGFSDTANLKGIDIAGKSGDPVFASAAGKVVYAGSGLRGYGKLVIVKHNATFLTAYAHNREILVKEGQQVAKGQKIAEMGNTDTDQVKLHFEIRRLGKPTDPLKYLPPT